VSDAPFSEPVRGTELDGFGSCCAWSSVASGLFGPHGDVVTGSDSDPFGSIGSTERSH